MPNVETNGTQVPQVALAPKKVELIIPQEIEINGLKISNAIIKTKIAEVTKMKIDGVDDKAGYDAAVKAKSECVKLRTQSEAWRKDIVKPINNALTELKSVIDGFGKEAKVGEDYLTGIIEPIDAEKARIKQEKEQEKLRVFQERVSEIMALGAQFDGVGSYTFQYDQGLFVNSIQLKEFTVEEFTDLLEEIKTSFAEEQTRLEEEKAEQDRLEAERINQEAANKAKAIELRDRQRKVRMKELGFLGTILNTPAAPQEQVLLEIHGEAVPVFEFGFVDLAADEIWDLKMLEIEAMLTSPANVEITATEEGISEAHAGLVAGVGLTDEDELDKVDAVISDYNIRAVSVNLVFTDEHPFKEIDISPKFRMRFYPSDFEQLAAVSPEAIAASGEIDSLRYMLIKMATAR